MEDAFTATAAVPLFYQHRDFQRPRDFIAALQGGEGGGQVRAIVLHA
jgi:hypothetical protein